MSSDIDHGHGHVDAVFVSVEAAATLVGVSARTVRRWITAGDVQAANGPKSRTVSVSDVRRRAALGHGRSRPPRPQLERWSATDTDMSALMSAVSAAIAPQLAEITAQVERLTREIGEATMRAERERVAREAVERDRDEQRASRVEAEAELAAFRELLRPRSHPTSTPRINGQPS